MVVGENVNFQKVNKPKNIFQSFPVQVENSKLTFWRLTISPCIIFAVYVCKLPRTVLHSDASCYTSKEQKRLKILGSDKDYVRSLSYPPKSLVICLSPISIAEVC